MYSMKEVCKETNMPYETLKFYCNVGLVPNVKRNRNNYRVFDDKDIAWIKSLSCLKKMRNEYSGNERVCRIMLTGRKIYSKKKNNTSTQKEIVVEKITGIKRLS